MEWTQENLTSTEPSHPGSWEGRQQKTPLETREGGTTYVFLSLAGVNLVTRRVKDVQLDSGVGVGDFDRRNDQVHARCLRGLLFVGGQGESSRIQMQSFVRKGGIGGICVRYHGVRLWVLLPVKDLCNRALPTARIADDAYFASQSDGWKLLCRRGFRLSGRSGSRCRGRSSCERLFRFAHRTRLRCFMCACWWEFDPLAPLAIFTLF